MLTQGRSKTASPWYDDHLHHQSNTLSQTGPSILTSLPSFLQAWTLSLPLIQPSSPAKLVASTISRILGARVSDYTYVDFASGAGGPTPYIEQALNKEILIRSSSSSNNAIEPVKFVLTDLKPHTEAWKTLSAKSDNLSYVARGVDAANAPRDLLDGVVTEGVDGDGKEKKKVMRLFSLAFHHFDDDLASKILENTAETADGFW